MSGQAYALLLFANPKSDLALKRELEGIREVLKDSAIKPHLHSETATFADIPSGMRYHKDGETRILHFAGHTDSDELVMVGPKGIDRVSSRSVAAYLKTCSGVQLVFLNGCTNREQAVGLLNAGIPAVIVTSKVVPDDLAANFAIEFYKELKAGKTLEAAFEGAKFSTEQDAFSHGRELFSKDYKPEPNELPWHLESTSEGKAWRLTDPITSISKELTPKEKRLSQTLLKRKRPHQIPFYQPLL